MRLPVIKAKQGAVELYIGKISAKELIENCVTTEWDPDLGWDIDSQGYQRAPIVEHYKKIANFLASNSQPVLPTAALISAREDKYGILEFKEAVQGSDIGYLEIPEGRNLFIVDYQHRWRGFQEAINTLKKVGLNSFQIPFVLMANASPLEEKRQFYLINNKQKRVDTDLALALMMTMSSAANEQELLNLVGSGYKYRIRGTRITFKIAALNKGCWVGKILEPNNPTSNGIVSIKSFVDSLKPILGKYSKINNKSDAEIISAICSLWEGIKQVMPQAFNNAHLYAIQKTTGLFVMHRVAAKAVFPMCAVANNFKPSNIASILKPATADYLNAQFWKTGGGISAYSSGSGVKVLADEIIKKM